MNNSYREIVPKAPVPKPHLFINRSINPEGEHNFQFGVGQTMVDFSKTFMSNEKVLLTTGQGEYTVDSVKED